LWSLPAWGLYLLWWMILPSSSSCCSLYPAIRLAGLWLRLRGCGSCRRSCHRIGQTRSCQLLSVWGRIGVPKIRSWRSEKLWGKHELNTLACLILIKKKKKKLLSRVNQLQALLLLKMGKPVATSRYKIQHGKKSCPSQKVSGSRKPD
jgi:hypothetical protein